MSRFCHDFALFYPRKLSHNRVLIFLVFFFLSLDGKIQPLWNIVLSYESNNKIMTISGPRTRPKTRPNTGPKIEDPSFCLGSIQKSYHSILGLQEPPFLSYILVQPPTPPPFSRVRIHIATKFASHFSVFFCSKKLLASWSKIVGTFSNFAI